ncbi:glycine zipper 2TM domain-containing protein [Novosphingobium sp. M1R2S20]|uniref:17 kDa surface antigen n=1 Tax=Novosphingobium rhizovicinum TaxID=3228928 RepID=A0ABV3R9H2_9SPHN
MVIRTFIPRLLSLAAGLPLVLPIAAVAREPGMEAGWREGRWHGADQVVQDSQPTGFYSPAQEAWLADCRARIEERDDGAGGALIGGAVGGVIGNRIAGRGNRTTGTLAGAAVGATAGTLIDRAEDRERTLDECEAYLDRYYAQYESPSSPWHRGSQASAPGITAYGSGSNNYPGYDYRSQLYAGCCHPGPAFVPAPIQATPQCTETIEYVYEDVPVKRPVYRPTKKIKRVRDKRVRITGGNNIKGN